MGKLENLPSHRMPIMGGRSVGPRGGPTACDWSDIWGMTSHTGGLFSPSSATSTRWPVLCGPCVCECGGNQTRCDKQWASSPVSQGFEYQRCSKSAVPTSSCRSEVIKGHDWRLSHIPGDIGRHEPPVRQHWFQVSALAAHRLPLRLQLPAVIQHVAFRSGRLQDGWSPGNWAH